MNGQNQHRPAPRPNQPTPRPLAPKPKPYKPKPTLVRAVQELIALETTLTAIGQPTHSLNPLRAQLQERMEALTVNWDNVDPNRRVMAFGLSGSEWWPIHSLEDCNPSSIFAGGIFGATYSKDGNADQGPFQKYHWAHCTMDDTVNYHWLDPVDVPEPEPPATENVDPCPHLEG